MICEGTRTGYRLCIYCILVGSHNFLPVPQAQWCSSTHPSCLFIEDALVVSTTHFCKETNKVCIPLFTLSFMHIWHDRHLLNQGWGPTWTKWKPVLGFSVASWLQDPACQAIIVKTQAQVWCKTWHYMNTVASLSALIKFNLPSGLKATVNKFMYQGRRYENDCFLLFRDSNLDFNVTWRMRK